MFFRKRADVNSTLPDPPLPKIVSPTGTWDGNDGSWSTFWINVGDGKNNGGGQNFKVLPSMTYSIPILPWAVDWCNLDCFSSRGVGTYNGKQVSGLQTSPESSTWNNYGIYDLDRPYWWFNKTDNPGGDYGLDFLGIGEAGPSSSVVPDSLIAGSQSKDFYIGQFGLGAGSTRPGGGKDTIESFLSVLGSSGTGDGVPSISYGYTAGAKYRNGGNGAVGSLVLGGYDETRMDVDKSTIIRMPSLQNNTLSVGVQSITYEPNLGVEQNSFSFTNDNVKGFRAVIDSTFPYLWLPDPVCDHFVDRFNLKYDNKTDLYLIGSNAATNNDQQNATVSFKIGSDEFGSGTDVATIVLPYSAFDLKFFEPPDNANATQYFPIKKSPNGLFVLGRTFLQEAYIIVDYERANFTVAPALFPDESSDIKLIPIYNTTYNPNRSLVPTSGKGGGLSGGVIAGIVIGILVALLGVALGFFVWWKKRKGRETAQSAPPTYKDATEIYTSAADNQIKHHRISELASAPDKPTPLGGFYGDNHNQKGLRPIQAIPEMESPNSPPAELYSAPAVASTPATEGNGPDYFTAGATLGRRGATRESSASNTPGTPPPFTPMAELPGDGPKGSPIPSRLSLHKRGPSETQSQTNIAEVMNRQSADLSPTRPAKDDSAVDEAETNKGGREGTGENTEDEQSERRPSHTRGLSDTTVQSDTTAVSQPTAEELERWAHADDEESSRPLSE